MRDVSIFSGVKFLGEYSMHLHGATWQVYKIENQAHRYIGALRVIKHESNAALYARAAELD